MINFCYRVLNGKDCRIPLSFDNSSCRVLTGSFIIGAKSFRIVINIDSLLDFFSDSVYFIVTEIEPLYQKSGLWFSVEYKGVMVRDGFKNKIKLTGMLSLTTCDYSIIIDLFDSSFSAGRNLVPMVLRRNLKPRQVLTASAA